MDIWLLSLEGAIRYPKNQLPGTQLPGRRWRAVVPLAGFVLSGLMLSGFTARADVLDDVGYTRLVDLLGAATPNGKDVPISMVEAFSFNPEVGASGYKPDATDAEFTAGTDPSSEAVTFTDRSNVSSVISPHATTTVGANFFGNTQSMAGGANLVTLYEAGDWMARVLKSTNNREPTLLPDDDYRVQNFSWVSTDNSSGAEAENRDVLVRFDYLIDTYDLTALVGLANNINPLPHLLGQSYNAIAVGRSDGIHSSGLTQDLYGAGRSKPDLVVPIGTASAATAVASSAATLLQEVVAGTDGTHAEVIKAMLLAGATKNEFPGWSRTPTQPLDDTYGAGELNIFNSWRMALLGQGEGSLGEPVSGVSAEGWDFQTASPGVDYFYNFEVPEDSTVTEFSIALAWNVEVTDTTPGFIFSGDESLANLNLALYDSTTEFLGSLIDESVSQVDNVEHIVQTGLGPGLYTLKVSLVSADFDEDGDVDGADFVAWQRGYGTTLEAIHGDGDADFDGDVDQDDLALLQAGIGSTHVSSAARDFGLAWRMGTVLDEPLTPLVAAVPEPGTLVLALLVAMASWVASPRRAVLAR